MVPGALWASPARTAASTSGADDLGDASVVRPAAALAGGEGGHWRVRSRPVSLPLQLGWVIFLCVLLVGKMATSVWETGNGLPSSLGRLSRCCAYDQRGRVWAALSLLLVMAGDVETNPGPISGEGKFRVY